VRLFRYFVRRSSTTLDGRRQVAHRRAGLSVSAAVAAVRIRLSSQRRLQTLRLLDGAVRLVQMLAVGDVERRIRDPHVPRPLSHSQWRAIRPVQSGQSLRARLRLQMHVLTPRHTRWLRVTISVIKILSRYVYLVILVFLTVTPSAKCFPSFDGSGLTLRSCLEI